MLSGLSIDSEHSTHSKHTLVQRSSPLSLSPTADNASAGHPLYGTTTGMCIDEKVLKQISENQSKFMRIRITAVEKQFGSLCDVIGSYTRALCKVRDCGDQIAKEFMTISADEQFNPTLKRAMADFASNFGCIQDYEESEVRRIEEKVLKPMTSYGTSCKHAREKLKKVCIARKKELEENKSRTKEQNFFLDDHHTTNLHSSSINALHVGNDVEQEIEAFERKKLEDFKQILKEFVNIQLFYHIRAMEQLYDCSRSVAALDVNYDLKHFLNSLLPISMHSQEDVAKENSGMWSTFSVKENQSKRQETKQGAESFRVSENKQPYNKKIAENAQQETDDDEPDELEHNKEGDTEDSDFAME